MPDIRMPDGTIIRNVPAGTSRDEILRRYNASKQSQKPKNDTRPESFWQGVVSEGGKALSNLQWVSDALTGKNIVKSITGQPTPHDIQRAQLRNQAARSPYKASTAGKITGGVVGSLPSAFIPGGVLAQGAAGGAMLTDDPNNLIQMGKDAAIGLVAGKIGQQVGKRVVAPVAERVGRTAPAQAVGKAVRGMFGNRAPKALPVPAFTPTDKTINRFAPELEDVRTNLADAQRLGLPYSLADASPELRQLAGSVSRKSPQARALVENTFGPRARGQADRLVGAIDDRLAPITDIAERAGEIKTAAQTASRPFYDEARVMAAPVDEELTAMLRTPAGKSALKQAYTIAANEGRDPQAMGMFTDDAGTVWMGDTPTFETLQLVKRGLDAELAPFRNPVTNKLDLEGNPTAQSVNDLLGKFNTRLKDLNEPYRLGNEAYARQIGRRGALELGQDMASNNVPQRTFDAAMGRMDDLTMPELQRGYATSMADTANRMRFSGNPYEAVYGSPLQQGKVSALFPEGADDFARLYSLEGDMAKTAAETLGGSQTQPRAIADKLWDSKAANFADAGLDLVTNPQMGLVRLGAQKLGDQLRTGGEKKAAAIAPDLFNADPATAAQLLDDLMRRNAEMQARVEAYRNAGSLLGVPAASLGIAGSR